jgi:fatty-acyl-CoA synthase
VLDADQVRRHTHDRLARFKQPKYVIYTDALPRNATGKVQKFLLRDSIDLAQAQ